MSESTETARNEEPEAPAAAAAPVEANHDGSTDGEHHEHDQYPFLAHHYDTPEHQFESGKLGIWIFLVTEVLFFAGLFCAYSVYRGMHPEIFYWAHFYLDTNLGAVNTIVLIVSSFTAAWAVRNAQLSQQKLLVANIIVTVLCAFTFMTVKYVEYSHKFHDGLLWGGRPTADGQEPKFRFDPHHHVWELHEFEHKHPEAAAAARRLYEAAHPDSAGAHGEHAGAGEHDTEAASSASSASSSAAAPTASASAAAPTASASAALASANAAPADSAAEPRAQTPPPTAASSAGVEDPAPAAGQTVGGAPAVAERAAAGAPTDSAANKARIAKATSEGGSSAIEVSEEEATAALTALAEMTGASQPGASAAQKDTQAENPLSTLTDEEAMPLLRAGVIGPNAVTPTVPSHPKNAHIFFGIYFFMTGLHGLHVTGGIVVWLWLLRRALRGEFGPKYFGPIDFAALYWHLVDLVWIYLFPLLYLIH